MSIKVMSQVWEHSQHNLGALLLMLAIADHADDHGAAFPSIARLAKKTRMTERNVQLLLKRLTASGELTLEPGQGPHGCHLYKLTIRDPCLCEERGENFSPEKISGDEKFSPEKISPSTKSRGEKIDKILPKFSPKPSLDPSEELKPKDPPLTPQGEGGAIQENLSIRNQENIRHRKMPRPQPTYTPGFLQFWEGYPPARRASKPSCLKLWHQAQLEDRTAEVCGKVEGLKRTVWQGKEPHFIPMTLTWLSQGRYDDDPLTAPAKPVLWAWARDLEERQHATQ